MAENQPKPRIELTPEVLEALRQKLSEMGHSAADMRGIELLLNDARDALSSEEADLALLIQSQKEAAVITLNNMGLITGVCLRSAKMLGQTPDKLVGKPIDLMLRKPHDQPDTSAEEMSRAEEGEVVTSIREHLSSSGESFEARHTLVAVLGRTGEGAGFVRTIEKITGRRIHEVRIEHLKQTIALLLHH